MNWFAGFSFAAVAGFLSAAIAQTPSAINSTKNPQPKYAGDSVCASCHAEKVQTFHLTSHYLTSRLPDKDSILARSHRVRTP
jgi:hypothetical protein